MNRLSLNIETPVSTTDDDERPFQGVTELSIRERLSLARDLAQLENEASEKRSALKKCERIAMQYGTVNELALLLNELQASGLGEAIVSMNVVGSQWRSFPNQPRTSDGRLDLRSMQIKIVDNEDDCSLLDESVTETSVKIVLCNSWPEPARPKKSYPKKPLRPIVSEDEDVADDDEY